MTMPAGRLAFPKSRRLTRPGDFEQVKKNGRVQHGRLLTLSSVDNQGSSFRAGFITSRRVGGAVVRNRIRRRLREIVRKHQALILDGVWVVTIARMQAARADYHELEAEWLRLARRAFILAP